MPIPPATGSGVVPIAIEDEGLDLEGLSLADLLNVNIEVTSVSKKGHALRDSAAAVTVLTAEDLRRSGATTLMEALRMVPGLNVARINSSSYAISVRGFNSQFANKMLVLIDGRSVYTTMFSGVFWSHLTVMLEDVARIEVIRGPGASLWGANAVNGVINIITQTAGQTQGGLVSTRVGTEARGRTAFRYGGETELGYFRIYSEYEDFDRSGEIEEEAEAEGDIDDSWDRGHLGFRSDWDEANDHWTLLGDVFQSSFDREWHRIELTAPYHRDTPWDSKTTGANLLARWSRDLKDDSEVTVQAYVDRTEMRTNLFDDDRTHADIEVNHRLWLGQSNELIWGFGYRFTSYQSEGHASLELSPTSGDFGNFSAFFQNEHHVDPEHLSVVVGAKYEHNAFSGDELQPNVRVRFSPSDRTTLWMAASRAIRTPSESNRNLSLNLSREEPTAAVPFDLILLLDANDDFESEELTAYEVGVRFTAGETLSFDVAAFLNDYDNLETVEPIGAPTPISPSALIQHVQFANSGQGQTYGFESSAQWIPREDFQVHVGYSLLRFDLEAEAGSGDLSAVSDDSPRHQAHLRAYYDWDERTELDGALYYVDQLTGGIDSYVRADLRLGRTLTEDTTLSLAIQGLFHSDVLEAVDQGLGGSTEVQAGAYLSLTTKF
ncbi:MAG: TonB-dependent receptor [Gammaproteobacteria bacterium]|nr:TonB-dependent receptor [Gammaproteobacteria bacterium]